MAELHSSYIVSIVDATYAALASVDILSLSELLVGGTLRFSSIRDEYTALISVKITEEIWKIYSHILA